MFARPCFYPQSLLTPGHNEHVADISIRLFERGANSVGLDFLAHPFWDKYLDFEERLEESYRIFALLNRIIHIPMHQYARYFERYRNLSHSQPLASIAPAYLLSKFQAECIREAGPKGKNEAELERDLRAKVDAFNMEAFQRTATETNKRWTFESEIKRPYFHVNELEEPELANWEKYLDFEELEGNYQRTQFLYERCLVTCAYYDSFWLRYARWMLAQEDKDQEVRNIFERASCVYVPISRPEVRMYYAYFEEASGNVGVAIEILEAVLINLPGHLPTVTNLANMHRRQYGFAACKDVFKKHLQDPDCTPSTKGALVSELAKATLKSTGDADETRKIFQTHQDDFLDSMQFWSSYLLFELDQPTSANGEPEKHHRIKAVHDAMRQNLALPTQVERDLSSYYLVYLQERGGKEAMKEFMELDKDINGPVSVANGRKARTAEQGKVNFPQHGGAMDNGHFQQQEQQLVQPTNGQASQTKWTG